MTTVTETDARQSTRWSAALAGALLSLTIAFGICAGLIAVGHQTFFETDDGARQRFQQVFPVLEGAANTVLGFQRVPVTLDRQEFPGSRPTEHLTYRIVVSPLGGLLLVGLALLVGGAVMQRMNGGRGNAIASGARMAALFAAACFSLSFILPLKNVLIEPGLNASNGFTMIYRPAHIGALIWPLVWGLVFASLGAFIGKNGRGWRRELMATLEAHTDTGAIALRSASRGLATGTALVLLAGVLTAVVGIATHPKEAGEVLGSARNVAGIAEGVVLGLPHATGAGLVASMGVPARYKATDHSGRAEALSQTASIFSGERQRFVPGGAFHVPRYALGGLLIATAFTIATGYRAAALSGDDVRQATRSAVAAAACLTLFLWIVGYLVGGASDISLRAGSGVTGGTTTIGLSPLPLLVVTPLWTFGGAFVGAILHDTLARRRDPAP